MRATSLSLWLHADLWNAGPNKIRDLALRLCGRMAILDYAK